jgi:hypothetical protein
MEKHIRHMLVTSLKENLAYYIELGSKQNKNKLLGFKSASIPYRLSDRRWSAKLSPNLQIERCRLVSAAVP